MRPFLGPVALLLALCCLVSPRVSVAQDAYPSRPIRLIVDGPPGGTNDVWGRRYAQRMSEALKQPIVVENRPGASGTIAAEAVSKAPADGYTVLLAGMNPMISYPGAGGPVRYDPQQDFVPVGLVVLGYPLLAIGADTGARSVSELVARGKARAPGDDLACGTAGQASVQQFACEMFARAVGLKVRTVPYKGGVLALSDVASGVIPMAPGYTSELLPFTTPGRLVALGVFGPSRLPSYPSVPTMSEAGLPGIDFPSFSGFYVPAGTPPAAVERLNAEMIRAMQQPQMKEWVAAVGGVWQPMTPVEFGELVRREQGKWKRMSEQTGIRVEP